MVGKSASFGHGSLVCGLWLAGGGRGGSVPTYILGTFYIRFILYQGYGIPVLGEAHCTIADQYTVTRQYIEYVSIFKAILLAESQCCSSCVLLDVEVMLLF